MILTVFAPSDTVRRRPTRLDRGNIIDALYLMRTVLNCRMRAPCIYNKMYKNIKTKFYLLKNRKKCAIMYNAQIYRAAHRLSFPLGQVKLSSMADFASGNFRKSADLYGFRRIQFKLLLAGLPRKSCPAAQQKLRRAIPPEIHSNPKRR